MALLYVKSTAIFSVVGQSFRLSLLAVAVLALIASVGPDAWGQSGNFREAVAVIDIPGGFHLRVPIADSFSIENG